MKTHTIEQIDKYYKALKDLKSDLSNTQDFSIANFMKEHRLGTKFSAAAQNLNIIRRSGSLKSPNWEWTSTDPNRFITKRVLDEMYNINRASRKKSNIRKKVSGAKPSTIDKYVNSLRNLQVILKSTGDISMFEFSNTNRISKGFSTAASKAGIIKYESNKWKWIAGDVNSEMAKRVISELSKLNPPRKTKKNTSLSKEFCTFKTIPKRKEIAYFETRLLFGLIKLKTKANYK